MKIQIDLNSMKAVASDKVKDVASALNTRKTIVEAWLGDWEDDVTEAQVEAFDKAVMKLVGPRTYEKAHRAGRVWDLLLFKLGMGPAKAGGVDLAKL